MGILNVTPDSFADGGDRLDPDVAIAAALGMAEAGADLIDLGAASVETKGPKGDFPDVGDGRILAGLTDE